MKRLVLLTLVALAALESGIPLANETEQPDNQEYCIDCSQVSSAVVPSLENNEPAHEIERYAKQVPTTYTDQDRPPIRFLGETLTNWLIALFTFVLTAVTLWQGFLALRALRISKVSANAARDSADVARDAFTKLERPYVAVSYRQILRGALSNPQWLLAIELTLRNVGKTPAILHEIDCLFAAIRDESGVLPQSAWQTHEIPTVLTTGGTHVHPEFRFTPETQTMNNDLQTGAWSLIIVGRISYSDVFGNSHASGFGFRYDFPRNDMSRWGGSKYNYY